MPAGKIVGEIVREYEEARREMGKLEIGN